MSKKVISRLTLRLALVAAVLACAMIALACTAYAEGEGVVPKKVDGKYEIYNGDQFYNYRTLAAGNQVYDPDTNEYVNGEIGASAILKADIDLDTATAYFNFNLFENESQAFTGTLDGDGHTISGFPSNIPSNNYQTLFRHTKGTIKNLTIDVGTRTIPGGNGNVGVLCSYNYGVISGVAVKGDITYSSATYVAMMCGINTQSGMVMNCHTDGSITAQSGVSTVIGTSQAESTVKNCYNTADVTDLSQWPNAYGLIRGTGYGSANISNCYSIGTVIGNGNEYDRLTEADDKLVNCYKKSDTFTAADLGDAFMDDLEDAPINNGYPVLAYQITGEYPHVEGPEDIEITKMKSVSETSLSAVCGTKFEYYQVKAGDFTVKVKTETGAIATIPVTSFTLSDRGNLTLEFSSISKAKADDGSKLRTITEQDATVELIAGGKSAGELPFKIAKSNFWSDYASEPEKIDKNDPRYGDRFSGYYKITKPEELAWVAVKNAGEEGNSNTVSFTGNCFLTNDIVLNDTTDPDWKKSDELMIWDLPIGFNGNYASRVYAGTFDGNGYSIKGVYMDYKATRASYNNPTVCSLGLFGCAAGTIRNISVVDAYINAGTGSLQQNVGGLVGNSNGIMIIENCLFDGEVHGGYYTAGILGGDRGSKKVIRNCVNKGRIYSNLYNSQNYAAGIVSLGYYDSTIDNCYNVGEVDGSGIIAAYSNNDKHVFLTNCYNAGKTTIAISGASYPLTTDNCFALTGCGTTSGNIDVVSEDEAKDGTLLEYLDSEDYVADDDNINNGYPILKWQSRLVEGQEKYPEELDFLVDITEYGMNRDEIQTIIDEAKDKIANAKSSAEADAAFEEAIAAINAIPNDEQVKQNMADELARLEALIKEAEAKYEFNMCLISLDKTEAEYSGSAIEPVVTATTKDGAALVKDTDYEVAYDANVAPGVAKVLVTGKGSYAGTREITFNIAPAANKILECKKAKKAFTVTWTKDELGTGYEVSYGLKKNFKGAKTVKIAKSETTSKKVSKLKAKKKYFVRVRTYVTSGEQTVYGAWSPVKSVKTK